jgi:ParB family chromosome partitioning protein
VKKGLGRGLGALLDITGDIAYATDDSGAAVQDGRAGGYIAGQGNIIMADIRSIEPSRQQPRQLFDENALRELAESIKAYGIIQPLIVKDNGDYFTIIAGERRYRAARLAKLETIPVIVKDYTDMEILQIALIENIQRQDLTLIEEANCYQRLMEDFFFSAEDIAQKVGKNKHAITNMLHLLELDGRVRSLAADGQLSASHGRVLTGVKDADAQFDIAIQIIKKDLSVRQTENLVAAYLRTAQKEENPVSDNVTAAYRRAEDDLKRWLGSNVHIRPGKKKGKIEIEYYSAEELERLLGMFKRLPVHTNPATQ